MRLTTRRASKLALLRVREQEERPGVCVQALSAGIPRAQAPPCLLHWDFNHFLWGREHRLIITPSSAKHLAVSLSQYVDPISTALPKPPCQILHPSSSPSGQES